jgi:hypothetical protein
MLRKLQYAEMHWYRHACAIGAVFNILMMITTTTIGFVLGVDNTLAFLKQVFGTWSGRFSLPSSPFAHCACETSRRIGRADISDTLQASLSSFRLVSSFSQLCRSCLNIGELNASWWDILRAHDYTPEQRGGTTPQYR